MDQQTGSVLGQVLSSVQHGPGDSALQIADSNPVPVVQTQTGVSAAEIINENNQRYSPVNSEGVASAGNTDTAPRDRMDEFVPVAPSFVTAAGFEGETSGGDVAGGSTGFQEAGAASPMDFQAEGSAQQNLDAMPSHIGGGKRKNYADDLNLESKRAEGGVHRSPSDPASDLAMVTGDSEDYAAPAPDACDSNADGGGGGSLENPAPQTAVGQGENVVVPADRPTDADIIAWENQIREQGVLNSALVGDEEDFDALEAEYAAGSDVFRSKIAFLRTKYAKIRRTRGDGNCFFRSFAFAYLEHLLCTGDEQERDRAVARLQQLQKQLMDAGYDEFVLESPMEMLLGMLKSIGAPMDPLTMQVLEVNMRDDAASNYIVFLLRMITAAEVKRRAEFFAPFIIGLSGFDVETFCSRCIDPMGEESDHVQLVALTDALQVPIRVAYLDRSDAGGGAEQGMQVDMHDFVPNDFAPTAGMEPKVHLLYRPGHYDIVYPRV